MASSDCHPGTLFQAIYCQILLFAIGYFVPDKKLSKRKVVLQGPVETCGSCGRPVACLCVLRTQHFYTNKLTILFVFTIGASTIEVTPIVLKDPVNGLR